MPAFRSPWYQLVESEEGFCCMYLKLIYISCTSEFVVSLPVDIRAGKVCSLSFGMSTTSTKQV
jgi:hypothetical protein